jgi:hypothetical protein
MSIVQIHHIFSQMFSNNRVIELLAGEFDIQASGNLIPLPTDRELELR